MMTQAGSTPATSVILAIDDDPAMRSSLKFALEIEGFSVRVYPTGPAVLHDHAMPSTAASLRTTICRE
jgi:FixJ family two-component response regulator